MGGLGCSAVRSLCACFATARRQHRSLADDPSHIRGHAGRDARGRAIASGKSRLWAIEQAIRSGSSAGVLAWVAAADDVILRRLQLAAEEQGCWVLLFRPASTRSQRSPAALRIHLSQARVEILKCWGGRPGVVDVAGFAPDPPQVPSR